MNQPFTASEVRDYLFSIEERSSRQWLIAHDTELGVLRQFVDLLEADEKAEPVLWVDKHELKNAEAVEREVGTVPVSTIKLSEYDVPLYSHPAPADAGRLAEALLELADRWEQHDYDASRARNAAGHDHAMELRQMIAAQAQPPAASVTEDQIERACRAWCADQGWDADAPVSYAGTRKQVRNRDGSVVKQWEMHVPEATVILKSALLAAQENPNENAG